MTRVLNRGDTIASFPYKAMRAGNLGEAVNDGFRGVSRREHATIGFSFEYDAVLLKPGDGVGGVEARERAAE